MPLQSKFSTTASLEGGDLGDGLADRDGYSVSLSMTNLCSRRDIMALIRFIMPLGAPISPAGPSIMPLGASEAVVNHTAAAEHITSRRYNTL